MYNIAIIGFTGNVGRCILSLICNLVELNPNNISLFSPRAKKKEYYYKKKRLNVELLSKLDFKNIDIAIFAINDNISKTIDLVFSRILYEKPLGISLYFLIYIFS